MVAKAVTASFVLVQSMSFTTFIIITPTITSEGPIAQGGTLAKSGVKNIDRKKKNPMKFADNRTTQPEGSENVLVKREDGRQAVITKVLYVP